MVDNNRSIDITNKIETGIYKVSQKKKCRSKVWEFFCEVLDDNNVILKDIVVCRFCNKILKYINNSTTNLIRHKCYINNKPSENNEIDVDVIDKKKVLKAAVNLCVKDVKPFSIIEGSGMKEYTKSCIEIGAKYGKHVSLNSMLPCSNTISNNVTELYNKLIPIIRSELELLENMAATTDIWTDDHKKISYLSLTVHYILNENLMERTLAVRELKSAHTGRHIFELLKETFENYGKQLTGNLNIIFVTDRGSNIIKALEHNQRYSCIDHLLHNVLVKSIDAVEGLKSFFEACKNLVRYFKKSSIINKLNSTLKAECITRWTSKYDMCVSIQHNMHEISLLLNERGESHRLRHINSDLLVEVINFLKSFNDAFLELQQTKNCTLHLVFILFIDIKKKA